MLETIEYGGVEKERARRLTYVFPNIGKCFRKLQMFLFAKSIPFVPLRPSSDPFLALLVSKGFYRCGIFLPKFFVLFGRR